MTIWLGVMVESGSAGQKLGKQKINSMPDDSVRRWRYIADSAGAQATAGSSCYSERMLDPQAIALLGQLGVDAADFESLLASAAILSVVALVMVIPTGIIAKRKNRSRSLWVLFALSIPLIPLLLIMLLPAVPTDRSKKP